MTERYLLYQFLNSADIVNSKLTENEFNEILNENDFSKIVIVNGDYAQLFLKSEALDKEKHSKNKNPSIFNAASPTYTYDFGDLQNFENKLNRAKEENGLDFDKDNWKIPFLLSEKQSHPYIFF